MYISITEQGYFNFVNIHNEPIESHFDFISVTCCGDTCQVWKWCLIDNMCFDNCEQIKDYKAGYIALVTAT